MCDSHPRPEQLQLAAGLLAELLPLDGHRRAEVTVFPDFDTAARTDPAFGAAEAGRAPWPPRSWPVTSMPVTSM